MLTSGHSRTYCRPCSRLSASPAGHATLLPWLAPQQHTRLRALGLATPAVAVDAQQVKQRTCSSARAARGRGCRIKSGVACRGSWFSPSRGSGVLAKVLGSKGAGLAMARVSSGGLGGTMCMPRGRGRLLQGPWPGHRHARITQRRRVGELQPELYFLAVGGQFHELVKRRKNRLRASRACSRGAPGRAHPVGNARRPRRRLAGLARCAGSGRSKCT